MSSTSSPHPPPVDRLKPGQRDALRAQGPVISARRARQGRNGLRILTVLTVSLTLVVIALAVVLTLQLPGAPDLSQAAPAPMAAGSTSSPAEPAS